MKVERIKLNVFSQVVDFIDFFVASLMMHNQQAHPPIFVFDGFPQIDPPGGCLVVILYPSRPYSLVGLKFKKSILSQLMMGIRGWAFKIVLVFVYRGCGDAKLS